MASTAASWQPDLELKELRHKSRKFLAAAEKEAAKHAVVLVQDVMVVPTAPTPSTLLFSSTPTPPLPTMEQKSLNDLTLRELVQLLKTRLEVGEDKHHPTAEIEVDEVLTSELQITEDVHELQIDDVGCSIEGNGHQIEEGEDPEVVPLQRKKTKKRKVMHDVHAVIGELSESGNFIGHVHQLLASCPTEILNLVKQSILQAVEPLKELLPAIMNAVIGVIVKKSNEDLKHLKGITATYRMTNKLPVRHSPYVSGILHPLKVFLEGERIQYLSEDDKTKLCHGSTNKITASYYEMVSEVVNVARKTESSLQRLRQGAQRRVGASTDASDNIISDTDKICMQLFLDIQEYARNLHEIGIDAREIDSYRALWQCVAPKDKQENIEF
ncbi:hypothetical protein PR202_gb10260 [Eleusine coracana subsp. coracana]|uniref:COG complex component COG2 C-terminal domain-containing protein n=1 Tax=Eleusine coracana subsp. coracana TaxID=191504 RepID=A0AAV5EJY2_ELECO|nr:hypothetical protein PR202_gb10260 [Eleusine coracana subsp. coracana]